MTHLINSFFLAVVEKSAKLASVHVLENGEEEFLVEFKDFRILLHYLPDAVDELEKDGRSVLVRVFVTSMAHSLNESIDPDNLNENKPAIYNQVKNGILQVRNGVQSSAIPSQ